MVPTPRNAPRGFTLVELLVVLAIIALISAVALPMVLPALNERRVSEAARLLQATLAGSRDAAIRANAPRGFRLLPDPGLNPLMPGSLSGALAMNRLIPIEPAPDYSEGLVNPVFFTITSTNTQIRVNEVLHNLDATPANPLGTIANPTSWYWNIRQGDKIRFNDSGPYYTIAGPMKLGPATGNLERYINNGPPAAITFPRTSFEYLILTNGKDDDGDGFTDESFDGLDNDGDGIIDPAFNGIDDDADGIIDNEYTIGEYENETFVGTLAAPGALPTGLPYTILRRPIVSPGAKEVTLPAGIVIDLTTWNAPMTHATNLVLQPERSRLPVDPYTFFVDILIAPNGQVVQGGPGSAGGDYNANAPGPSQPFYQFWLTERQDVFSPLWGGYSNYTVGGTSTEKDPSIGKVCPIPLPNPNAGTSTTSQNFMLPVPQGTIGNTGSAGYPGGTTIYNPTIPYLTGERRLVTLFVKTGQITSNSIQSFSLNDTNAPFYDSQSGTKEPQ